MLGKKHKPESIKKLRDFNLGKKLSQETKDKMSKLECRCKKMINVETGEIFNSIKELALFLNIKLGTLRWNLHYHKKYKQYKYYINE